jgi:hypothetical protein
MQRFEDVLNYYIDKGNINVINMLNTKYVIVNGDDRQPVAQRNPGAMGNAWFVENIEMVNSNEDELHAIDSADLQATAFVHNEFKSQVDGFDPVKGGSIALTSYTPDELVYKSSAPTEQFAVFSDVYYGPDKGWQAYIDGVKAPHIRTNYILRAMRVPAGDHEIRFKFEPKSYRIGEMISLVFSLLIVLLLVYGIYSWLTTMAPLAPVALADSGIVKKPLLREKRTLNPKKKK